MMMQTGSGPVSFSDELNPLLRQMGEEPVNIFGKKVKKKDITKILGELSKVGASDEDDEEGGGLIREGMRLSPVSASAPKYSPLDIYGGFLSMYGGQKVRGGLLGE
jgi:hypothetical protein